MTVLIILISEDNYGYERSLMPREVVSYWSKNVYLVLEDCPWEACLGTGWVLVRIKDYVQYDLKYV